MKAFYSKPFHPILFCVYPIFYLFSRNLEIFTANDTVRPLVISTGLTVLFLLCFRFILKDWHRAALLCTYFLVMFFSFGHLVNADVNVSLLTWVWFGLMILVPFFILRVKDAAKFTLFLNAVGALFLLMTILTITQYSLSFSQRVPDSSDLLNRLRGDQAANAKPGPSSGIRPDVYFIILDSYERADALKKYYHFDNSAFINALRARGFYVADQSRSNYVTTVYSLPSTLNLVYLNDLSTSLFTKMTSSLQIDYVHDFLQSQGYTIIKFESGFGAIDDTQADVVVSPFKKEQAAPKAGMSQFDLLLLQTSVGRLLFQDTPSNIDKTTGPIRSAIQQDFYQRRQRIESAFSHLPDYGSADGDYFLFAHIQSPHNPYLWDAHGNPIDYNGNEFLLGDKINTERNIKYYTDQMQYINQRALDTIDRILRESKTPPIIILEGDHGHDTFFEWDSPTMEGVDLRSAILNAYYFPDGAYQDLYPSISPVNSFRVVFNHFFGTRFPLLPDQAFTHKHPNAVPAGTKPVFTDICSRFSICSPTTSSQP